MKAVKLQLATRTLLNPGASQWSKVPTEALVLAGAPVHLQPSRYIRTVWAGRPVGAVRSLKVQTAHNSRDLLFRLEWADETKNTEYGDGSVFPDACSVIFPLNSHASLDTMGSPDAAVNAWYWRANFPEDEAQNIVSSGLGTEQETNGVNIQARARWEDGRWQVVFARPLLLTGGQAVALGRGKPAQVAFAVWEGSSQERAGLNSFSKQWRELVIE
jgi:complex iron-sulfur molybdoenzyme family reductase subunit gamma